MGLMAALPALATGPVPVPIPKADFEVEYERPPRGTVSLAPHLVRYSGGWYRGDIDIEDGKLRMTTFSREGYDGSIVVLEIGAAKMTYRLRQNTGDPVHDSWSTRIGTRSGEAHVAGESCEWWKPEAGVPADKRVIVCLTQDGIMLSAVKPESRATPIARAVEVRRRRQNPALFSLPPGAAPREVADVAALMREVEVWTKSMARPRKP